MEIEEEATRILIPPLILQPLVENALVHGLEGMNQGGKVLVLARHLPGVLQLVVSDNGIGMTPERLQENRDALDDIGEDKQHRIGLRNVHQRLVLNYGKEYGLRLESREGQGTTITFHIPGMKEEKPHVQLADR